MELILELLAPSIKSYEESQPLLEFLGKLSGIDKALLAPLRKKRPYMSSDRKKPHGADQVAPTLGAESEVTEVPVKSPADFMDKLKTSPAAILTVKGDQMLIVVDKSKLGEKEEGMVIMLGPKANPDEAALTKMFVTPPHKEWRGKGPSATQVTVTDWQGEQLVKGLMKGDQTGLGVGKIKDILKMIFDRAKADKEPVAALVVSKDVKRSAKQSARQSTRRGMIPLPDDNSLSKSEKSAYGRYINQLRSDLKDRLDTFKSSRVGDKFESAEEMLKGITEKGFMEKLKFMGYTYDKHDTNRNLDDLMKGRPESPGYPHVAIIYQLNSDSQEYKALRDKLQEIRAELSAKKAGLSEEEGKKIWEEYYEQRRQLAPPGKLKIAFDFKGGALVPSRVIFDKDSMIW